MTTRSSIDELLDAGDLQGAVRQLRHDAGDLPLPEVAAHLRRAAALAGFDDVEEAATSVLASPDDPAALFALGYACVERGIAAVAVPVLEAALAQAPGHRTILGELVSAYEDEHRYPDAVAVLEANPASLEDWPERYLLAINSLLAGDVDKARAYGSRLSEPTGDWVGAGRRIAAMLDRAALVPGPLDHRALRAWHYVLNGGVLAHLSPYGFDEGMNGRYAFIQDTADACHRTLRRLGAALAGTGLAPTSVSLLTDRSSRILGLAASTVLGLPAVSFEPDRQDTIVVAYNLFDIDPDLAPAVRRRAPGSILVEQATCWTGPPPIAADLTGLLHQVVVEPWGRRLTGGERSPADDRPEEEIAAEIAASTLTATNVAATNAAASNVAATNGAATNGAATPAVASTARETGGEIGGDTDGETAPGDGDADFAAFVSALRGAWPVAGELRDRVWSPGPVRSSYFA